MQGVDPKYVFWLGILVTIETAIGQGAIKLTNVVPADIAPYIIGWSQLLGFIGTTIMTALSGFSSANKGVFMPPSQPIPPAVKPIIILALVLTGLLAFGGEAKAQQRNPVLKNIIEGGSQNAQGGGGINFTGSPLNDLLGALDAKLLPDLQYALKLAQASGSKVTAPCYSAWIDIINVRQKAVQNDATPPEALPMPDPHLVTDFEKLVELRNSLQPDSPFMIACSPVASMVKKDMLGFIGIVVGGSASLATLVPGL